MASTVALVAAAILAFLFVRGSPFGEGSAVRASALRLDLDDDTVALERATVLISQYAGDRRLSIGSGTIVSPDGLILTNAHVGDPTAPGLAVQYAAQYAAPEPRPDRIVVALFEAEDAPARDAYVAEVAASDGYLDLTVLRIVRTVDGAPVDLGRLDFPSVPVGDSSDVSNSDVITIVGYPGVGGGLQEKRINVSRGIVSGFQSDPRVESPRGWVKTDATIAHGNSGGLAADDEGRIIGIPTRIQCGSSLDSSDCDPLELPDVQGKLRPVNLAKPLIEAAHARSEWVSPYIVETTGLEKVTFLGWARADLPDGTCTFEKVESYPGDTTDLAAVYRWDGMTRGVDYLYAIGLNQSGRSDDWREVAKYPLRWSRSGTGGCDVVRLSNAPAPLPTGSYGAVVAVGASYATQGGLEIVPVGVDPGESNAGDPAGDVDADPSGGGECDSWSLESYQDGGWPLPSAERGGTVIAASGIASLHQELGPRGGYANEEDALRTAQRSVRTVVNDTPNLRWLVLGVGSRYQAYEARMWFPLLWTESPFGKPALEPNPFPRPCTIPLRSARLVAWHALGLAGVPGGLRPIHYTWTRSEGGVFVEIGGHEIGGSDRLLAMIPDSHRSNCSVTQPSDPVIASVYSCSFGTLSMQYVLFGTRPALQGWYQGVLRKWGLAWDQARGTCPQTIPSEGAWRIGDVEKGRLACFVDQHGGRQMVWTYYGGALMVSASSGSLTAQELFDWWVANAALVHAPNG